MSLVELKRFYSPVEAELARLRLANEGIESIVFDGEVAMYVGAATGVRLMVLDDDEAAAKALLAD
jgi:putative signal transducing protein